LPLTREQIVNEALALLDESGLGGLTLRKLAARLGVSAPTLYWHVSGKADLIGELAETILRAELANLPAPGHDWRDWLADTIGRFRRAMLAHPDGARIVSAAQLSATMAAFSDQAMSVLVSHGVPLRQARLTVVVAERFTIGHVLEEQSPPPAEAAVAAIGPDTLASEYPTLVAAVEEYFAGGRTIDDLFRDSIRLIVDNCAEASPGTAAPE
jgi:TetR/AcrR family tetracycline transcriptional repressor